MKLLSIDHARAIWLMPMNDINPKGKYIFPLLLGLIDKYKFRDVPNLQEAFKKQQGIRLGGGAFDIPKTGTLALDFSIFNDGLVADTRSSTDDSELFLKEVFNWGSKEFGIQLPAAITRQYLSEFNFELDHPLSSINPKLAAIGKKLGEKIGDENIDAYEFSGISFGKQWTGSGMRPQAPFRIERANNSLAKDNRFWTSAPLRTNDHMNLVDGIVALLKR